MTKRCCFALTILFGACLIGLLPQATWQVYAQSARPERGTLLPPRIPTGEIPPAITPDSSATPTHPMPDMAPLEETPPEAAILTPAPPLQTAPQPLASLWVWNMIEQVSHSSSTSSAATVAIARDGTVYTVWAEARPGSQPQLYYSRNIEGLWTTPTPSFMGKDPDLALSPDGTLHLVYSGEVFGNQEIFYTTWVGGNWTTPEIISHTDGVSVQPAIVVREGNEPIVVWTEVTEGYARIEYAWKANGLWCTYLVPATSGGSAPAIALGEADRVWVIWQVLEGSSYHDIYALHGTYDQGIAWSQYAMNISDSPTTDSVSASLAGVPGVGVFAVWQESDGQTARIYYADNLEYGDFWSEPVCLSQPAARSEQPSIAAYGRHSVHIAWDAGNQLLHCYRLSNGAWSPCTAIANDPRAIGQVALAIGPDRTVHAVWSQQMAAQTLDIYHRSGMSAWPYHAWLSLIISP